MNTLHVQDEWDEHSAEHRLAGQQDGLREDGPDPDAFPDAEDDPEEELSGFEGMSDEDIALLAQRGDVGASEYLLNKYKNFVRSKARSYFLVGADH